MIVIKTKRVFWWVVAWGMMLPFILYNCKDPEPYYDHVSQELKDWGAFKPGTWWVYEEQNSEIKDSVFVYSQEVLTLPHLSLKNNFKEEIKSYIVGTNHNDTFFLRVITSNDAVKLQTFREKYREHSSSCYLVAPPPIKGYAISNGPVGQFVIFDTIYSKYRPGDLQFNNVVRANDNMNLAFNWTPTLIYSAKNIGIVRKEFPAFNQIWNLVDYHIVQ
jgi:hypothetical protein